jgi:hypothetical protein
VERNREGSLLKDRRVQGLIGLGVAAGFLIGLLVFGEPWHLPPAWGDIPTWITAIATIGLLIGAIVTAMYAIRAFNTQSDQLNEQRDINALQAKELDASLRERERVRRTAERDQADAVGFEWWPTDQVLVTGEGGAPVDGAGSTVLVVNNESRRRIVKATCRIEPSAGLGLTLTPERAGQLVPDSPMPFRAIMNAPAESATVSLIRRGAQFGFLLRFDLRANPTAHHATRFTDDAGLHWQIDQDLHLQQLDNRDDW